MQQSTKGQQHAQDALKEILRAIESLRYGSVEITAYEGRVTLIERGKNSSFRALSFLTYCTCSGFSTE